MRKRYGGAEEELRREIERKGAEDGIKKDEKKWRGRLGRNQDRLRNSDGNWKFKIPKGR